MIKNILIFTSLIFSLNAYGGEQQYFSNESLNSFAKAAGISREKVESLDSKIKRFADENGLKYVYCNSSLLLESCYAGMANFVRYIEEKNISCEGLHAISLTNGHLNYYGTALGTLTIKETSYPAGYIDAISEDEIDLSFKSLASSGTCKFL